MTRMSKWLATSAACCFTAMWSVGIANAQDPPPVPPPSVPSVLDGVPTAADPQLGGDISSGDYEPGIISPTDSAPIDGEVTNEYVEGGVAVPGETIVGGEMAPPSGRPDLFYNYYVAPRCMNGNAAGMYTSPGPVPPNVGHTYYTYQPFYPHEFLYPHYREYYNYHSTGECGQGVTSYNKTEVTAYRGNFRGTFAPALIGNWYRARKYGS